jgi:hypothetical protein
MAARSFALSATYQNAIRTNGAAVLTNLTTNPGSTNAQVQSSTGLAQVIVDQILAYGVKAGVFVARANFSGVTRYWTAATWASRITTYLGNARTWADALGAGVGTETALAAALVTAGLASVESEAVAITLTNALVNEANGEIVG